MGNQRRQESVELDREPHEDRQPDIEDRYQLCEPIDDVDERHIARGDQRCGGGWRVVHKRIGD